MTTTKARLYAAGMVCAACGLLLTQLTAVEGELPKWVQVANFFLLLCWGMLSALAYTTNDDPA